MSLNLNSGKYAKNIKKMVAKAKNRCEVGLKYSNYEMRDYGGHINVKDYIKNIDR
jgi:hypothetical protein